MRQKLTPAFVRDVPPPADRAEILYWDTELTGFGLAVTKGGHKAYVVKYRAGSRQRRMHLKGGVTVLSLTDARKEARKLLGDVAKGGDPLAQRRKSGDTLRAIVDEYVAKEGARLRTMGDRKRDLERLVLPKLGSRQIEDIGREDIRRLFDRVECENGAPMADLVLAYLRRVMSWHASRSDTFRSPIVRGMARTSPTQRRRQRILTDDELRALWRTAEASPGPFASLVRFILLTATRRNEAARIVRAEIGRNSGEWIVPAARMKNKLEHVVPLSDAALEVINAVPRLGRKGYVFTTDGKHPISGFSKFKATFDTDMLAELRKQDPAATMPRWTLHDLRRTARSLMSRAGVPSDHAERCLAHVLPGIRGTYDRYEYLTEKRQAFAALAALIDRIISPPAGNVVPIAAGKLASP